MSIAFYHCFANRFKFSFSVKIGRRRVLTPTIPKFRGAPDWEQRFSIHNSFMMVIKYGRVRPVPVAQEPPRPVREIRINRQLNTATLWGGAAYDLEISEESEEIERDDNEHIQEGPVEPDRVRPVRHFRDANRETNRRTNRHTQGGRN